MRHKSLLAALFFLLLLSVHAQDRGTKMNPKEIKLLVDSVSASLKRWYIYPEKAELISTAINDKYKTGAYNKLQNRQELAEMIHDDVQKVHHDGHMRVMYFPDFEKKLLTVLPDSLQKKEEEMELYDQREHNFYFVKSEIMPGNIGYLRWDGFVDCTKEAQPTYEAAFKFVSNAKALILDMRFNGGGSPETVNAMLNYFFNKKLPMNHIIDFKRDTVKHYVDPSLTSFKLNMPVYVLTGKHTFSGAEDFTYAMKYAKRAIIVGDTTGGGAHPTGPAALGQGFVLNIPNARSYHEITGTNWEGTGVYPDVYVNGDNALEQAQILIFRDRMANAGSDNDKKELQWQLYATENKVAFRKQLLSDKVIYTQDQLKRLCGEYENKKPGQGSVTILMKEPHLFIHFNSIKAPDLLLTPIGNTRFYYGDDSGRALDFVLDKDGNPTGIQNTRANGTNLFDKVK
jgi:hypothetical protein